MTNLNYEVAVESKYPQCTPVILKYSQFSENFTINTDLYLTLTITLRYIDNMTSQHNRAIAEVSTTLCFRRSWQFLRFFYEFLFYCMKKRPYRIIITNFVIELQIQVLLHEKVKMFSLSINKKNLVIAILIGFISFIGDLNLENQNNRVAAAVCDNVTHALIGVFTWIGAFLNRKSSSDFSFLFEIFLCGLFSSVIDVDHFIAAKSFRLKDATSLKTRPFMHCTTLVIFIVSVLLIFSYLLKINWLFKFGWILTAAFLSHHIRDSKRRGLWIWPFGHTMPVPWLLQLFVQMLFPYFLSVTISRFSFPEVFQNEPILRVETV